MTPPLSKLALLFFSPVGLLVAGVLGNEVPTPPASKAQQKSSVAPMESETPVQRNARMAWWREARFGLFLHWGLYAVPATGEWVMNGKLGKAIPVAEYKKFAPQFNPQQFNAAEWVRLAKDAGQKYIIITAKHHEGFAMFATKASDFNIIDATPFKRDPLAELAQACRQEGMKLGFYYSHAQDWTHPGGACRYGTWDKAQEGDMDAYLEQVSIPQVKELLSNYGEFPSVLWWDTPLEMTPERAAKFLPLLNAKPGILFNNRLGGDVKGDMETPEQFIPILGLPGRDWETCMTMNNHWGYSDTDSRWKSAGNLITKLVEINSRGGNFLLNVGPDALGRIPAPGAEVLRQIGAWLKINGESIYATTAGPFWFLSWGNASRKGQTLYCHVQSWPKDGLLRVPLMNAAGKAWLLAKPGESLTVEKGERGLIIHVPSEAPDPIDSVVALTFEGAPNVPDPPSLNKPCRSSSNRKNSKAANALNGSKLYWDAEDTARSGWIEVDLGATTPLCGVAFRDPVRAPGKHQQNFVLQYQDGDAWKTIIKGQSDGHGIKKSFPLVQARVVRLNILQAQDAPGASQWLLFSPE